MNDENDNPAASAEKLHEHALRHLGRRLFAEARQQSDSEDAEYEARHRERRKMQGRNSSDAMPAAGSNGADGSEPVE